MPASSRIRRISASVGVRLEPHSSCAMTCVVAPASMVTASSMRNTPATLETGLVGCRETVIWSVPLTTGDRSVDDEVRWVRYAQDTAGIAGERGEFKRSPERPGLDTCSTPGVGRRPDKQQVIRSTPGSTSNRFPTHQAIGSGNYRVVSSCTRPESSIRVFGFHAISQAKPSGSAK